ncbi:uncharacterized protein LOC125371004 [Ricinus communis]|uniref:uncharacterized protein LOC125371004 n=1 Tax=Ricinus communis TaxID=3988 RepID=UPI00201A9ADA|nr:uncharacterized protein LOC125371004 [Ricinus communis]
MSRIEIDSMARKLGMKPKTKIIMWKDPTKSMNDILRSLETDSDALKMAMSVEDYKLMHIFSKDKFEKIEEAGEEVEEPHASEEAVKNMSEMEGEEAQNEQNMDDESCKDSENSDADSENSEFVDFDYDLLDENVDDDAMFDKFVDKELERDRPSGSRTVRQPTEELSEETDAIIYAPSDELLSCSSTEDSDANSR